MKNCWDEQEAAKYAGDLGLRVYSSRLLGQNPSLVLHGGGNTSVKIREPDIFDEERDILYVKGSGWDLEKIQEAGFAPVKLDHLLKLAQLEHLTDTEMVNQLKTNTLQANAPTPSIETILHAVIPLKYVDHTHADAIVTITNTEDGKQRIEEIFGPLVIIIPYIMPGFDLARICADRIQAEYSDTTIGMVLMNHGVFSFGDSAKQSYDRMIQLVSMAEDYLESKDARNVSNESRIGQNKINSKDLAKLRSDVSHCANFPMLMVTSTQSRCLSFANRDDIQHVSQQGPATPDHIIRTKKLPMLGRDVRAYAVAYEQYFKAHATNIDKTLKMLDAAPRVILDPEFGLCTLGRTFKEASIVNDIYQHTIDIIERATLLGGYSSLGSDDLFAVEYWELEQAKIANNKQQPLFNGEVVMITGAASGIGKSAVAAFLKRGAAVIACDLNADVERLFQQDMYFGCVCDITDKQQVVQAFDQGVLRFGGIDMLVLNAGIFSGGCSIESFSNENWNDQWQDVFQLNVNANLNLLNQLCPYLKLAPRNGRVVIVGSKNVAAPGPGAAAYSCSKAALNQLARVAALEWGKYGIRINTVHPNAVFDTKIWNKDILLARAQHYGVDVETYKRSNILKTEIKSHDVAELIAEMCGPVFSKTTGAQIPIDGGNERVV